MELPRWLSVLRIHLPNRIHRLDPWVGKILLEKEQATHFFFWHGEFHGLYSPWGRKESEMTERLHFHFSVSCIGERNGNPLQCSYLENPRDGEAWWAAVYGVAQSWTRLK